MSEEEGAKPIPFDQSGMQYKHELTGAGNSHVPHRHDMVLSPQEAFANITPKLFPIIDAKRDMVVFLANIRERGPELTIDDVYDLYAADFTSTWHETKALDGFTAKNEQSTFDNYTPIPQAKAQGRVSRFLHRAGGGGSQ
jgi:hypothetical protein